MGKPEVVSIIDGGQDSMNRMFSGKEAIPSSSAGWRMMRLPDAPTGGAPIGPIRCRHPAPGTSSP